MDERGMSYNPIFTQYYNQGLSFYEAGRYKEAVPFFGKALKINPFHNDAFRHLLMAFYFVKQRNRNMAV